MMIMGPKGEAIGGRLVASRATNFRDHVWGGHLHQQMQGAALLANAKTAIEKQVNEFH